MASTLTLAITFNYEHTTNGVTITKAVNSIVAINGNPSIAAVQNIGITDEVLQVGDVNPSGYALFHNLDATNSIQIADAAIGATSALKLKADEWAVVRWNGTTVHAKALVAACDLEYVLLPD